MFIYYLHYKDNQFLSNTQIFKQLFLCNMNIFLHLIYSFICILVKVFV